MSGSALSGGVNCGLGRGVRRTLTRGRFWHIGVAVLGSALTGLRSSTTLYKVAVGLAGFGGVGILGSMALVCVWVAVAAFGG